MHLFPEAAVYLVAQYARYEMRKMEAVTKFQGLILKFPKLFCVYCFMFSLVIIFWRHLCSLIS